MNKLKEYLKEHKYFKVNNIYISQEIKNVLEKYNLTLYELCYRIRYNISLDKVFVCKYCGKTINFDLKHGYKSFCNHSCSSKYIVNLPEVQDKMKATTLERYGVECSLQTDYAKQRFAESCMEK